MYACLGWFFIRKQQIPIAFCIIVYLEVTNRGALIVGGGDYVLLMFAGLVTAIPLALFSYAANKISLITVGICEYISPSLALIIGVFVLKEQFDVIQLFAFIAIWIGLVFFTYGEVQDHRKEK